MDIGKPIIKYGPANISQLRKTMLKLPANFWETDRVSRMKVARNRPGNVVFFYNDVPPYIDRAPFLEAQSGFVNVLRYTDRPLFAEIQNLIESRIMACVPDCDILRVQLAELPPGEIIRPHYDRDILAVIHRLHIPIVTHKRVKFTIAGQAFFLEEGMLYNLNNVAVHSVENNSHIMRVHLLIDMMPHSVARARYHDTEESMVSACANSAHSSDFRSAELYRA